MNVLFPGRPYYGLGYYGYYGLGHYGYPYAYWGRKKREATAEADATADPHYGYYGYRYGYYPYYGYGYWGRKKRLCLVIVDLFLIIVPHCWLIC